MTTINPIHNVLDRMLTISRAMDDASGIATGVARGNGNGQPLWLPAVDLFETEHAFVVDVDLPGMKAEGLELHFEQNTLTIKGSREAALPVNEGEGKATRIFSVERPIGAFTRSIRLPEYVDGERIDATFEQGVLRVRIPKATNALPRRIAVKNAER